MTLLAVLRLFLLAMFFLLSTLFGLIMCIVLPFNRNNVHRCAQWFSGVSWILGVKLDVRVSEQVDDNKNYVYVSNHQNNYDLFTVTKVVPKNTVSIGKKSLKWIPFFGQLYWLSGNILIDRTNRAKAANTIGMAADRIKKQKMSVWLFPEGTRSYGRGLLPFKTGAFHTAMQAEVDVVPVCMSSTQAQIKLNRWSNGTVYIEVLAPVKVNQEKSAREHATQVHAIMQDKINQLDAKVESDNGKLARN